MLHWYYCLPSFSLGLGSVVGEGGGKKRGETWRQKRAKWWTKKGGTTLSPPRSSFSFLAVADFSPFLRPAELSPLTSALDLLWLKRISKDSLQFREMGAETYFLDSWRLHAIRRCNDSSSHLIYFNLGKYFVRSLLLSVTIVSLVPELTI